MIDRFERVQLADVLLKCAEIHETLPKGKRAFSVFRTKQKRLSTMRGQTAEISGEIRSDVGEDEGVFLIPELGTHEAGWVS